MSGDSSCDCKIGRVADARGIPELRSEVERRREDGASLRDLAREANVTITDAALQAVDAGVVGDSESVYVALSDDSVSATRQAAVRNQLSDAGIEVDDLEADFVSYQAVRYHLRECLDLDTSRSGIETVEEGRASLGKTRERTRETVQNTLKRLDRVDAISAGDVSATISIRVRCDHCGVADDLDAFLDRCGCDCDQ